MTEKAYYRKAYYRKVYYRTDLSQLNSLLARFKTLH